MSPEEQLLLFLARHTFSERDEAELQALLDHPLDWKQVLQLALQQSVYPLVHENLNRFGWKHVPADVRDHLIALRRQNAFRAQHAKEELTRVLNALDRHGVPAIPLKGLSLAQALYQDISLRSSADTDILVPQKSIAPALKTLAELGYTQVLPQFQADLEQTNIECQLVKRDAVSPFLLELHWAILWDPRLDREALHDLWSEATRDLIFSANAFRMSPEWEFLVLMTHAARNQWQGLKWLADIHDLCAACEIDWERVMQKAELFGWTTIVQVTLIACNTLFKTPIPSQFECGKRPPWLILFPSKPTELTRMLLPFRWIRGTGSKLRYVWFLLFIQKVGDWKYSHRLPPHARFLYTPFRVARLVRKFGPQLLRAIATALFRSDRSTEKAGN